MSAIKIASALIGAQLVMGASMLIGGAMVHTAHADMVTVDGTDYPPCAVEDCSDQPGQVGVWTDHSGRQWLSIGETSIPVAP